MIEGKDERVDKLPVGGPKSFEMNGQKQGRGTVNWWQPPRQRDKLTSQWK